MTSKLPHFYQTTRRHSPEDSNLHIHSRQNHKFSQKTTTIEFRIKYIWIFCIRWLREAMPLGSNSDTVYFPEVACFWNVTPFCLDVKCLSVASLQLQARRSPCLSPQRYIPEGHILPFVRFVTIMHRHIVSLCVTSVATNHAFLNLGLIRNVTPTFKTKLSHIPDHVRISVLTAVKHQIFIVLACLFNNTEFWKHFETPNHFLGLLAV